MAGTVLAVMGAAVGPDQPLVEAGLDSLGELLHGAFYLLAPGQHPVL